MKTFLKILSLSLLISSSVFAESKKEFIVQTKEEKKAINKFK